jgi:hypothetical protein
MIRSILKYASTRLAWFLYGAIFTGVLMLAVCASMP